MHNKDRYDKRLLIHIALLVLIAGVFLGQSRYPDLVKELHRAIQGTLLARHIGKISKEETIRTDETFRSADNSATDNEKYLKNLRGAPENDEKYIDLAYYSLISDRKTLTTSLKNAISVHPDDIDSILLLAGLYRHIGNYQDAELYYRHALAQSTRKDWMYIELGHLYARWDKDQLAEQMYKNAVDANPNNDKAYLYLGNISLFIGKNQVSEINYSKALKLNQKTTRTYKDNTLLFQGMNLATLEALPQKNPWAYMELGHRYLVLGRVLDALAMYQRAVDKSEKIDHAYLDLAAQFYQQQRYGDAEEIYKRILLVPPHKPFIDRGASD